MGSSPFLAVYISFLETDKLTSCPIRHFHESPLDYAQNTEPHERIRVSDRTVSRIVFPWLRRQILPQGNSEMNSLLDTLGKSYAGDGRLVLTGIIINSFLERADRAGLVWESI